MRGYAGAAVYDDTGALVAGGVSECEHELREQDAAVASLNFQGAGREVAS